MFPSPPEFNGSLSPLLGRCLANDNLVLQPINYCLAHNGESLDNGSPVHSEVIWQVWVFITTGNMFKFSLGFKRAMANIFYILYEIALVSNKIWWNVSWVHHTWPINWYWQWLGTIILTNVNNKADILVNRPTAWFTHKPSIQVKIFHHTNWVIVLTSSSDTNVLNKYKTFDP